jgi:hypothetical protein
VRVQSESRKLALSIFISETTGFCHVIRIICSEPRALRRSKFFHNVCALRDVCAEKPIYITAYGESQNCSILGHDCLYDSLMCICMYMHMYIRLSYTYIYCNIIELHILDAGNLLLVSPMYVCILQSCLFATCPKALLGSRCSRFLLLSIAESIIGRQLLHHAHSCFFGGTHTHTPIIEIVSMHR